MQNIFRLMQNINDDLTAVVEASLVTLCMAGIVLFSFKIGSFCMTNSLIENYLDASVAITQSATTNAKRQNLKAELSAVAGLRATTNSVAL